MWTASIGNRRRRSHRMARVAGSIACNLERKPESANRFSGSVAGNPLLGQGNVLLAVRFKLRNSSPVVHAQCLLALSPLIELEGFFEVSRPCISQQVFRRRRHAVLFSLPCFMIYSPQREALTGNRKIPRKDCRGGARRVVFFNGKRKKSPRPLLKRQELCAWSQVLGER